MRRAIWIALAVAALTTAVIAQVRTDAPPTEASAVGSERARKTLDTYCVACHNSRAKAGGVAFDALPLTAVHEHADTWEAAIRKLRGRLMPPPGSRQPDQHEIDTLVSWLEATLDATAAQGPVAGHVPIQRPPAPNSRRR